MLWLMSRDNMGPHMHKHIHMNCNVYFFFSLHKHLPGSNFIHIKHLHPSLYNTAVLNRHFQDLSSIQEKFKFK